MSNENGDNGDDAEIESTEESDLVEHLLDELAGRLARTEAGDVAAVLLQVVGHLDGIELDGGIEVGEEDYQQEIDYRVGNGVGTEPGVDPAVSLAGEGRDGRGDAGDGLSEDDGHNAGHVHLHGQCSGRRTFYGRQLSLRTARGSCARHR